jgi:hypothetical protein
VSPCGSWASVERENRGVGGSFSEIGIINVHDDGWKIIARSAFEIRERTEICLFVNATTVALSTPRTRAVSLVSLFSRLTNRFIDLAFAFYGYKSMFQLGGSTAARLTPTDLWYLEGEPRFDATHAV